MHTHHMSYASRCCETTLWQKQLKGELILAYNSKVTQFIVVRKVWSRKLVGHIASRLQSQRLQSIKAFPQWYTSYSRAPPPKGTTTLQNSAIIWEPSIQAHRHLWGILHIQTITLTETEFLIVSLENTHFPKQSCDFLSLNFTFRMECPEAAVKLKQDSLLLRRMCEAHEFTMILIPIRTTFPYLLTLYKFYLCSWASWVLCYRTKCSLSKSTMTLIPIHVLKGILAFSGVQILSIIILRKTPNAF